MYYSLGLDIVMFTASDCFAREEKNKAKKSSLISNALKGLHRFTRDNEDGVIRKIHIRTCEHGIHGSSADDSHDV